MKYIVITVVIIIIIISYFSFPKTKIITDESENKNEDENENKNVKKYTIPLSELRDFDQTDNHNVHNRPIQRENNKIIPQLLHLNQCDQNMYLPIERYYNDEKMTNILKIIRELDLTYHYIDKYNEDMNKNENRSIKEIDIIENVWKRIHSTDNIDNYSHLTDRFKETLLDTKNEDENDDDDENKNELHCKWGRVNRIIQTLQYIDKEIDIKYMPMWMIKDLIVNKIIQLKDVEKLKALFDDEYIKTGILTQSELDLMTNDYYNELLDIAYECG